MAIGLVSTNDTSRREDLTDVIKNVDPSETPFLTDSGKSKAANTIHQWLTDGYAASAVNAVIEGSDATVTDLTAPVRKTNVTQIFRKVITVSDTEQAINVAGTKDVKAYQVEKAMKEIAKDMERALIAGTTASGNSGVAAYLSGAIAQITTNKTVRASGTSFSEIEFNDILEDVWNDSAVIPDTIYSGMSIKRDIDKFTGGTTKFTDADAKKIINTISVYESATARHMLKLDREVPAGANAKGILAVKSGLHNVAELRPVKLTALAKTGSADKSMLEGEATLEILNEKAFGYRSGY
jgi:hypothetical protein